MPKLIAHIIRGIKFFKFLFFIVLDLAYGTVSQFLFYSITVSSITCTISSIIMEYIYFLYNQHRAKISMKGISKFENKRTWIYLWNLIISISNEINNLKINTFIVFIYSHK